MGRLPLRTALLGLAAVSCGGPAEPSRAIVRKHEAGRYSLAARDAALPEVAAAIEQAAGVRFRIGPEFREQRMTLEVPPRSLERLVHRLAREAGARLVVAYRLDPAPEAGETASGRRVFARELVQPEGRMPQPVVPAAAALGVPIEIAPEVRGQVSLLLQPRPLGEVLDAIAKQTRSRWTVVLRFDPRQPALDAEAARAERMHEHLDDLAQLSPEDRRAEIGDELRRLEGLQPAERESGVQAMATDIRSLGKLLQRVPGEHRGLVAAQVLPVARDYRLVLSTLDSGRQPPFQPLFQAAQDLEVALRRLR